MSVDMTGSKLDKVRRRRRTGVAGQDQKVCWFICSVERIDHQGSPRRYRSLSVLVWINGYGVPLVAYLTLKSPGEMIVGWRAIEAMVQ